MKEEETCEVGSTPAPLAIVSYKQNEGGRNM
jgi:hypothetical protein